MHISQPVEFEHYAVPVELRLSCKTAWSSFKYCKWDSVIFWRGRGYADYCSLIGGHRLVLNVSEGLPSVNSYLQHLPATASIPTLYQGNPAKGRQIHYFGPSEGGGLLWGVCLFARLFVCLSVCLSTRVSKTARPNSTKFLCMLSVSRSSGFTDNVVFSYHEISGRIKHDVIFRRVRQVAVPVGRQTTTVFGW